MGRILGLDVGGRRIGVAISDPDGRLAVPLQIIDGRDAETAIEAIRNIARTEQAESIAVGHPLSMNGSAGPQARRVEAFARRLAHASGLTVELWDERLTTAQVERSTTGPARRRRRTDRRPAPTDDLAAAIILQAYLDRRRASPAP